MPQQQPTPPPPFHVRDIDPLVLRVVDLQAMLAFYGQVLGCSVERRLDALGLVQLRAGRSLIDLVPVDSKIGHAGGAAPGRGGLAAHGMSGFVRALAFYPLLFYPALLGATLWVPIAAIWAALRRRLDRKEIA